MTSSMPTPVYLCYDERMLLHHPVTWQTPNKFPESSDECPTGYVFENPRRLECIYERLNALEERLLVAAQDENNEHDEQRQVFIPLQCKLAKREDILLVHTDEVYYDRLADSANWTDVECIEAGESDPDMYYCPQSFQAARLACGGVLHCVDTVVVGLDDGSGVDDPLFRPRRALALVRPPGHHACQSKSMGFCFLNSVAVAAKYALQSGKLPSNKNRVVIVDWDIHHGNGTQELTYDDPNIFYISLHRYDANFFPHTGCCDEVSESGTNLNVAWTEPAMGNAEYAAAFSELILPLIVSYDPGLVLVSCGLDAAANDLLGDCKLQPPFYNAMMRSLLAAVGHDTPVVVALEGGYTMNVIAECMEAVSLALLNRDCHGDIIAIDQTDCSVVSKEASLDTARDALKDYWQRDDNEMHVHSSAVCSINNSIAVMQACSRWDTVELLELVDVEQESSQHQYNTRSSNRNSNKSKEN